MFLVFISCLFSDFWKNTWGKLIIFKQKISKMYKT